MRHPHADAALLLFGFVMISLNGVISARRSRSSSREEVLTRMSEAMGAAQFQETSSAENVGAEVLDEESTMHVKRQATSNEEVQYYQGVMGRPGRDFPVLQSIPKTSFSCRSVQSPGYYADLETDCQVFHICEGGRKVSFLCPNGTVFRQSHLVCDWWWTVDCQESTEHYISSAELLASDQRRAQKNSQQRREEIVEIDKSRREQLGAQESRNGVYQSPKERQFSKSQIIQEKFNTAEEEKGKDLSKLKRGPHEQQQRINQRSDNYLNQKISSRDRNFKKSEEFVKNKPIQNEPNQSDYYQYKSSAEQYQNFKKTEEYVKNKYTSTTSSIEQKSNKYSSNEKLDIIKTINRHLDPYPVQRSQQEIKYDTYTTIPATSLGIDINNSPIREFEEQQQPAESGSLVSARQNQLQNSLKEKNKPLGLSRYHPSRAYVNLEKNSEIHERKISTNTPSTPSERLRIELPTSLELPLQPTLPSFTTSSSILSPSNEGLEKRRVPATTLALALSTTGDGVQLLTELTRQSYRRLFAEDSKSYKQMEEALDAAEAGGDVDLRRLARVFSEALSAYLEDPPGFRKALAEARPAPPSSVGPTEWPSVTKEDGEVLDFSDVNSPPAVASQDLGLASSSYYGSNQGNESYLATRSNAIPSEQQMKKLGALLGPFQPGDLNNLAVRSTNSASGEEPNLTTVFEAGTTEYTTLPPPLELETITSELPTMTTISPPFDFDYSKGFKSTSSSKEEESSSTEINYSSSSYRPQRRYGRKYGYRKTRRLRTSTTTSTMSTLQTTIITTTNEPTTIFETTTMPPVTTLTARTAPRINVTLSPSLNSSALIMASKEMQALMSTLNATSRAQLRRAASRMDTNPAMRRLILLLISPAPDPVETESVLARTSLINSLLKASSGKKRSSKVATASIATASPEADARAVELLRSLYTIASRWG